MGTTDGTAVPVATTPDLWVPRRASAVPEQLPRSGYDLLRAALLDPSTALAVIPLDYRRTPRGPPAIADPVDGLIVATAILPTRDRGLIVLPDDQASVLAFFVAGAGFEPARDPPSSGSVC